MTASWIYHFKWVYYALFGLAAGSFLNVIIFRLPLARSLFHPPSSCPSCRALIPWYDNIPVISFILLGARCRSCRAPISWRYPFVELLSMAIFLTVFFGYSSSTDLQRAYYIFFLLLLVAVALIDWDYQIIPDQLTYPGIIAGILGNAVLFLPHRERLVDSIAGAGGFALLVWLIRVFGGLAFRREAMGIGDIKLAAMMGAFLGWRSSLVAFIIAVFSALAVAPVVSFLSRRTSPRGLTVLVSPTALTLPDFPTATALSEFTSSRSGSSEVTVVIPGVTANWSSATGQPLDPFLRDNSSAAPEGLPASFLRAAIAESSHSAPPGPLLIIVSDDLVLSTDDRALLLARLLEHRRQIAILALDEAARSDSLKGFAEDSGGVFFPVSAPASLSAALEQYAHHLSFTEVPFGTFLAIGGAASIFSGEYLWALYISRFWS
jgi:leader peptidase (prepilin peptidase)/N-methyltransferase